MDSRFGTLDREVVKMKCDELIPYTIYEGDGCQYDVEFQGIYTHWMPIPYAPKDEFKSNNEVNNA